ncbi:ISAs1 family transposase [Streptomyces sp. NPDC096030]|uniref:ISAs1 family transposase n=1 Tax=Streptomyces sp. NPDC096030 TaxID=3155423 RepID=UPI003329B023
MPIRAMPAPALSCSVAPAGDTVEDAGPRDRRGRRYPLVVLVRAAACAVAAGARWYAAVGHWLRRAPQDALARLGFPVRGVLGVRPAAPMDTVRRVLGQLHPGGLAGLLRPIGTDRDRPVRLAADGKSARGSRTRTRTAAHLLAVIDQDDQVIAQLRIPDKTNEVPCLRALLAPLDIGDAWVSADALHTQRETARFLVEDKKAHYLFTVKLNQPTLYARCRSLPWEKATAKYYDRTGGHGRKETRVIQVLTVSHLDFPHTRQVARVTRYRTDKTTGKRTRQTVCVITGLPSRQAKPQDTALALPGHWHIENKIHYVRDTLWDEDRSRIRTGHGPENMATLRNTTLNRLRARDATSITEAVRDLSYEPFTAPPGLLGIPR